MFLKLLFAIFFGLLRTPALIYFVFTGFLQFIFLSLTNLIVRPFTFIYTRFDGINHNFGYATIVVFASYVFWTALTRLFVFLYPNPDYIPMPLLLRIFLAEEPIRGVIPNDMYFPVEHIPNFSLVTGYDEVLVTVLGVSITPVDVMIYWFVILSAAGLVIARTIHKLLMLANLD